MIRSTLLTTLALLTAAPSLPQTVTQPTARIATRSYPQIEQIAWAYEPAGSATQLRFAHGGSNWSHGPDDMPQIMRELATVSTDGSDAAVSFSLVREAGALACAGRVTNPRRAAGTCRFDPDERYVAQLGRRGLVPKDSKEVLVLALVDGRVGSVDDLARLGYGLDGVDDLIAVAALDVTPAFAEGLRNAGLVIDELDDLIAAQALGLDAEWLIAMARAGYPELRIDQAIRMRALGVTPDYAQRMARVLSTLGEVQ